MNRFISFSLVVSALVIFASCGAGKTNSSDDGASSSHDSSVCGDNLASEDEVCDGSDLQGRDCLSLNDGFSGGTLRCNSTCDGFIVVDCVWKDFVRISNQCSRVDDGFCESRGNGKCYYIDSENGDDNNSGSYHQPWRTAKNVSTISDSEKPSSWVGLSKGDVVYFMEGTHRETIQGRDQSVLPATITLQGVVGSAEEPIVIRNYPGHHAIFDPGFSGQGIFIYQSEWIHAKGIEIRNAYSRGLKIFASNNGYIYRMLIHNTDGTVADNVAGIEVHSNRDTTVRNCIFYDNYDMTAANSSAQTHNSCNFVLFRGSGLIGVYDSIFFQTQDSDSHFSGCGLKFKHASTDPNISFELSGNYFENHKYVAIGIGTHNAVVSHNIVNNMRSTDPSAAVRSISSRDWGGPTHQMNQVIEYNTIYSNYAFHLDPTLEWIDEENGPWNDLTGNIVRYNIVYTRGTYGESSPMELSTYMSDELYNRVLNGITFNYNCYYHEGAPLKFDFASSDTYGDLGNTYNLPQWQSTFGWDIDSVEVDPSFREVDKLDFTPNAKECLEYGALSKGATVSTDKVFRILCEQ